MNQLATHLNLKCVKIQIERQKFKSVIKDVLTEGVQGCFWQPESTGTDAQCSKLRT